MVTVVAIAITSFEAGLLLPLVLKIIISERKK
jgi:hypothetical protein